MKKKTGILSKIYIAILLIFLYSPIAVLIFYSFNNGKTTVWKGFTFKWYVQLFRDDNIMNALWNTVIIAVLASVFATILGTAAAIGISNFKGKKRMLIQNASNIPIISPDIVMGVSLMLLFTTLGVIFNFEMGFFTVLILPCCGFLLITFVFRLLCLMLCRESNEWIRAFMTPPLTLAVTNGRHFTR